MKWSRLGIIVLNCFSLIMSILSFHMGYNLTAYLLIFLTIILDETKELFIKLFNIHNLVTI